MTTIHTFTTVQGTTETRKSKTRQYAACLVGTITEQVLERNRESIAKLRTELATLQAELPAIEERIGLKAEEAQVAYEAEKSQDWFPRLWDMNKVMGAEMGIPENQRYRFRNQIEAKSTERLAEQGILDPYRKDGPYIVVNAVQKVRQAERSLERCIEHQTVLEQSVGHQHVISWHLTISNAQKALGGRDAESTRKSGYKVTIETSFEVRETKPRKRA